GHLPISKALSVPIIHHNVVIGIMMVANKGSDYETKDQVFLETITDYISPILYAKLQREKERNENVKKQEI
ncbi:MAG: GAF domain-containing protein, partial [Candidatus Hodarchaeales archaeon]